MMYCVHCRRLTVLLYILKTTPPTRLRLSPVERGHLNWVHSIEFLIDFSARRPPKTLEVRAARVHRSFSRREKPPLGLRYRAPNRLRISTVVSWRLEPANVCIRTAHHTYRSYIRTQCVANFRRELPNLGD